MRRLMAGMILLSAVSFLGLSPAHAGLVGIRCVLVGGSGG